MKTTTQIAKGLTATALAALVVLVAPAAAEAADKSTAAAAPLAYGAGYDLPRGSDQVRLLQRRLRLAGEDPGPVDGLFGPLTKAAVTRFQSREGLEVDGLVGPQTRAALRRAAEVVARGAGYGAADGSERVRRIQRALRAAGEEPGPIDGRFGPLTEATVIHFQQRHGLVADGVVGVATMTALKRQLNRATPVARNRDSSPKRQPQPRTVSEARRASAADTPRGGGSEEKTPILSAVGVLAFTTGIALGALAAVALGGVVSTRRLQARRRTSAAVAPRSEAVALLTGAAPKRSVPGIDDGPPVLGYATLPPGALGVYAEELRTQVRAIISECRRRGFVLVDVIREREPDHENGLQRPGLGFALRQIAEGDASGLVVADLSRISRSVTDLGEVLDWFAQTGARLVSASPGLDTGEESGRLAARALIDVSTRQREQLSERTRKGLEAARREGRRGGRSAVADDLELRERIARMRAEGMTLQAIADRLNEEGVPTPRGGLKWRPSSVQGAAGYRRPRKRGTASRTHEPPETDEEEI